MKKKLFYSMICMVLCGASVFSQDLYDQTAGGNGDGMISSRFVDLADTTITTADDFTVGPGDNWQVTDITIRGFRDGAGTDMTIVKVEVFANAGDEPATTAIYSAEHTIPPIPAPVSDTAINIVLNNTLVLTNGTYWLTIAAASPSTSAWHWGGVTGSYGLEAMADDSANYLGSITNGYTTLTNLGKTFTDLSFKIGGTGIFSNIDEESLANILIFPNPVTDYMTINNINAADIKSISVYNMNGQLQSELPVGNQVNLDPLTPGLYLIELNTQFGVIRKKIMKT